MYTIIGGDGKEYGPASVEQIRTWIVAGRADGNTQAKKEGAQEWRRLADIPEFQPEGARPFAAAEPPPIFPRDVPGTGAAPAAARAPRRIDIGGCYERGWKLLRSRFWPFVGVSAIYLALAGVGASHWLLKILFVIFGGALQAGVYSYFLKAARGQEPAVADVFSGFGPSLVQLVLVYIVMLALIAAGTLCLILPGIYLAVSYVYAPLLVLDRKMDFWSAMELSRRTVTAQWWRMLGMLLVGLIFALIGCAFLFVGLLVTLPIFLSAMVGAYEELFP